MTPASGLDRVFEQLPQGTKLAELERQYLQFVLNKNRGNLMATAREVGLPRATAYRKVSKYNLYRGK